jgi:hypothetical protein
MWEKIGEAELIAGPERVVVHTHRLSVPGGWLIRTIVLTNHGASATQTFVATIDHSWTPSHAQ